MTVLLGATELLSDWILLCVQVRVKWAIIAPPDQSVDLKSPALGAILALKKGSPMRNVRARVGMCWTVHQGKIESSAS